MQRVSDTWIRADWPAPANIVAGTTLRTSAADAIPLHGRKCWLHQVHGAEVVIAGEGDENPDADGSVSRCSANVCVVRTADCLPVLFCATDGTEVAAAHAGWRGLAAGILEATIATMHHGPADLMAWLGPGISQPKFEVGDEVREAFVSVDPGADVCFEPNERQRWQADLYGLAKRRLAAAGIDSISGGGWCTYADTERFYSWRRDKDSGRMVTFVGLK